MSIYILGIFTFISKLKAVVYILSKSEINIYYCCDKWQTKNDKDAGCSWKEFLPCSNDKKLSIICSWYGFKYMVLAQKRYFTARAAQTKVLIYLRCIFLRWVGRNIKGDQNFKKSKKRLLALRCKQWIREEHTPPLRHVSVSFLSIMPNVYRRVRSAFLECASPSLYTRPHKKAVYNVFSSQKHLFVALEFSAANKLFLRLMKRNFHAGFGSEFLFVECRKMNGIRNKSRASSSPLSRYSQMLFTWSCCW